MSELVNWSKKECLQVADSKDQLIYVRLPEELLVKLDIECARRRRKRPGVVAQAVSEWLQGLSGAHPHNYEDEHGSAQQSRRDTVAPIEGGQWSEIIHMLREIGEKLGQLGESPHGSRGNTPTRSNAADLLERVEAVDRRATESLAEGIAAREELTGTPTVNRRNRQGNTGTRGKVR